MADKKTFTLTEEQLGEMAAEAFTRGFDLGHQQGTEQEKQRWLHMTTKQSHQRILSDLIPKK